MIDFLKVLVKDKTIINHIHKNELLIWKSSSEQLSHFDQETINSKETKVYNGILFCFFEKKLEILIRPHYYHNGNLHNANDFSSAECIKVLNSIILELNLPDLSSFHIVNIEFGLNTFVPIDVKNFVRFISYHGRNEFRTDSDHPHSKKSSTYRKGNRNQYKIIKAYAKSVQFPEYTEGDVFRFEVKSKKSRYIKKLGIYSIEDLLLEQTYLTLGDQLYKEYKTVLLLDQDLDLSSLNENEKTLLLKLSNPLYWEKLLNLNRNTFQNNKKRYTKLLDKTGYNLLRETRKIMKDKIASLCCANSHILIK